MAEALDYVFGYTCLLDITVRSTEDRSTRKSFDTFTPIGPWVTTADAVGDPADLRLRCWVNDDLRQDVATKKMIFGVPELVAYASSVYDPVARRRDRPPARRRASGHCTTATRSSSRSSGSAGCGSA